MSNNDVSPAGFRYRPTFPDDLSQDNAIPGFVDPLDVPQPGVSPRVAVIRFFTLFARFRGRASRSEYWWAALLLAVVYTALGALNYVSATASARWSDGTVHAASQPTPLTFISAAVVLVTVVPWIALGVRRLHDTNRSGLLYFIALVPAVGNLVLLAFSTQRSHPEGVRFDRVRAAYPSDLRSSGYVPPAVVAPSEYSRLQQNTSNF